jgi:hypothetical protein
MIMYRICTEIFVDRIVIRLFTWKISFHVTRKFKLTVTYKIIKNETLLFRYSLIFIHYCNRSIFFLKKNCSKIRELEFVYKTIYAAISLVKTFTIVVLFNTKHFLINKFKDLSGTT